MKSADSWPVFTARGYALIQCAAGLVALFLAVQSALALITLAKATGALPLEGDGAAQRAVYVLAIAFQGVLSLLLWAFAITALFLASGMWRYREWARHATLVLAITSVPVLIVAPLLNWLLQTAAQASSAALSPIPLGAVIAGVLFCVATVYLFAYNAPIIALYLPRPNLVRRSGKFVYGATPIPTPFNQKPKRK